MVWSPGQHLSAVLENGLHGNASLKFQINILNVTTVMKCTVVPVMAPVTYRLYFFVPITSDMCLTDCFHCDCFVCDLLTSHPHGNYRQLVSVIEKHHILPSTELCIS